MGDLSADLILYNANVLTLDPDLPRAELVAVRKGKVLRVSTNRTVTELRDAGTRVVDCHGKTILPGLNDAHCHVVAFAESLLIPDFSPTAMHSISDIQNGIRQLSRSIPMGNWIRAGGYNEFYLAEKRHPTRWELDEAAATHPVKLTHRSGHAHVLNSLGLAVTGICNETPEPAGAMIERDLETGEPNGLLYGMGDYLYDVMPPLDESKLEEGIELASQRLLSWGVTSVQDASPHNDYRRWGAFQRWKSRELLKPRVTMMVGAEALSQCQEQELSPKAGDSQLRLGAAKIVLDETKGQLNPPQAELDQRVLALHQSGYQVALHAVEETTVEAACSSLEEALRRYPRANHRHRIEHCSVCTQAMAKRLGVLQAMVVTQPAFIYYSGERYLETVPDERLRHLYPVATLIQAGVKVAASSDCPVVPPNPLDGIYAAVSRTAESGRSVLPKERITASQALWMYTVGAAYASFEEDIKGSLVPGKLADLVVLSGDPTQVGPEEIKDLEVEMTVVGGQVVWARGV